jgi:2-oxoglutarate ferredoxin oxidoreductase subunit gamma
MEKVRLVFSGSGGQGVITAAIILAEAAVLYEGLNAVQSQTYGPEARGGATRSDVIISDATINFPKVIEPNVLVCLTQTAYNKFSGIIRPGGLLLTDAHYVTIQRKVDALQHEITMYDAVMSEIGNPVVFNICMLGTLVGLTDIVRPESLLQVIKTRIPAAFLDLNNKALDIGLNLGRTYKKKH